MPDFARSDDPAVQAQLDRLARLSPGGDRLGLDLHLRVEGLQPPRHQLLADRTGQCEVEIVLRRPGQRHPLAELQSLEELLGEPADVFEVGLQDGGTLRGGHARIVATGG